MRKILVVLGVLVVLTLSIVPAFAQDRTIVDIAVSDGRFDTLVAAVTAAGLVDTLASPGPFTVFAPTDAAFAALGEDTINALLANTEALTSVLLYHVVSGEVPASAVVGLNSATTVQGAPIRIAVVDDGVVLNGSVNVIITDIQASNGIIHVIDAVLLPPATGLNNLYLFLGDTPLLGEPAGNATNAVVRTCQTGFVTETFQNYGFVPLFNGWVDLSAAVQVAPTYGQPGGPAIPEGCIGR
jgi:hypothetical protein